MSSFQSELFSIPELAALDSRQQLIRIPPELDVPMTGRVRRLIDTAPFRRLAQVSQLGLVALVYPGAHHTRFEHSLGVYRLALLFLKRLMHDERFRAIVRRGDAEILIAAALLHDIGHWPCCHLIEDLALDGIPEHESLARRFITQGEIADVLRTDWNIDPQDVCVLLEQRPIDQKPQEAEDEYQRRKKAFRLFMSILSGPIDIDKMDYLHRDSHACGVPYGRNFDRERLIGSLCLNETGDGLAVSDKGKTAAELMVFARYVMFSEVYWHHTVRAATAMFQRIFEEAYRPGDTELLDAGLNLSSGQWFELIRLRLAENAPDGLVTLFDSLFGSKRSIYKRVRQISFLENPEIYRRLSGLPRMELRQFTDRLIDRLNADSEMVRKLGRAIGPNELLVDAPPAGKEIQFAIDVYYPRENRYRPLSDVSPVVRALAQEQFDDYVKQVRFFASEPIASALRRDPDLERMIAGAAAAIE